MSTQPIAIPAHIWDQDHENWKAWLKTRNVGSTTIVAAYKRYLTHFYWLVEKPIADVTEADLGAYAEALAGHAEWSERTQHNRLQMVQSYWRHYQKTKTA